MYNGVLHYFESIPKNIAYRDVALFRSRPGAVEGIRELYQTLLPYIQAAASADPTQPYGAPSSYTFTQTPAVPRSELPPTGRFQTWFPLPIEGGPQTNVKIQSVTPTAYLTFPASTSEDIGLLYMEVPLDTLATDLTVQVTFSFDHAPQYFKVDPDKIGPYDPESALYKQYTASRDNTSITPDIRATAQRVVGSENNAYRAARLLYYHVPGQHPVQLHAPHVHVPARHARERVRAHVQAR